MFYHQKKKKNFDPPQCKCGFACSREKKCKEFIVIVKFRPYSSEELVYNHSHKRTAVFEIVYKHILVQWDVVNK